MGCGAPIGISLVADRAEVSFFCKKVLKCYGARDNIFIKVNKVFRIGMQDYADEECLSCSKGVVNGKESNLIFRTQEQSQR